METVLQRCREFRMYWSETIPMEAKQIQECENCLSLFIHWMKCSLVGCYWEYDSGALSHFQGNETQLLCDAIHCNQTNIHDDVIKWKHFPSYWPFVRGIHWTPVNSPHKGQWCRALMFSLICTWINGWINNREADDLRRHHGHYDVTIIFCTCSLGCQLTHFVNNSTLLVWYRYPIISGVESFNSMGPGRCVSTCNSKNVIFKIIKFMNTACESDFRWIL